MTPSGPLPTTGDRQHSAKSRHSRIGWIDLLPLPVPITQPEPDFQFHPTMSW
jgi:hypothetical protein